MSKGNINLENITDLRLRDDGNEAKLTLVGRNGQSFTVTMAFEQLQQLVSAGINLLPALRMNRVMHSDTPKQFSPMREIHLGGDIDIHLPPDGSLDILLQTREGQSVQLYLLQETTQKLRRVLCESGEEYRLH